MNSKISLTIHEDKSRLLSRIITVSLVISFLFLLFIIFVIDTQKWTIVSVSIFFGILILDVVRAPTTPRGVIILSTDKIIIKNKNEERVFSVKELKKIKMTLLEYEGGIYKFNPQAMGVKGGINNYLEFNLNNEKFSFLFLLTRNKLDTLNLIFNAWKVQEFDFVLINEI